MGKLQDLQERKLKLVSDMRAENDSSNFNEEAYNRMDAELSKVEAEIKRELKLVEVERELKKPMDAPEFEQPKSRAEEQKQDDQKRYQDAFETMLRTKTAHLGEQVRTVLNIATTTEGGYTVPQVYFTTIINKLLNRSVMRGISNVIQTASTTLIPLGDVRPTFSLISESGAYPETNPTFSQTSIGAYKMGAIIKASEELLRDSFTDIQSYLTNLIVEGVAEAEDIYFTTGTGSSQPQGVMTGASLGKTTVSASAVTLDEVLDLKYSLGAPYRTNAKFLMNSATELAIRKLKDSQGQYLWQPSLQVGAPNLFDGKEIIINERVASIGTGNRFMAFGDFSYFTIADRAGIDIMRLDELYAGNGQVGWRTSKRFDSKVILSEAIKYMKNA